MSTQPERSVRLAVIVASTREGRFAPVIATWFLDQIEHRIDIEPDLIDLDELDIPLRLGRTASAAVEPVRHRLAAADGFVVITPEYNHSFPAALKQFIDLFKHEWQAKPASFVSYGGMSGGLRALEHLRAVFAELHTVTIRDVVSFHNPWQLFDQGELRDPDQPNAAAKVMLDELVWFADALRTARAKHPYGS